MQEICIPTTAGPMAGLRNHGKGPRVLALHGWLDNAASFLPMAPWLRDFDLVAIDQLGHGRSAHLPAGAEYNFATAINGVLDVADALDWERFSLLGHSMGAGIASLIAAACPERIEALVAIEALGALTEAPDRTVVRLREAIQAHRGRVARPLRVFPDIETAVRARAYASRVPGSGEPPGNQISAYLCATTGLRRGRITPRSKGFQNQRGSCTTRRSSRNSSR